ARTVRLWTGPRPNRARSGWWMRGSSAPAPKPDRPLQGRQRSQFLLANGSLFEALEWGKTLPRFRHTWLTEPPGERLAIDLVQRAPRHNQPMMRCPLRAAS